MEVVSSYPIEAKAALPRSMSFSFGCEVKAEIDSSFSLFNKCFAEREY